MRKKSIIVVLLAVLMSLVAVACSGGKYKFDEYTDFTGEDISAKLELDDDMTLDGVLDEEAWINVSETNKMSVTSSAVHKTTPDKALSMDVYTHFGEKALYFAFDVTDNSIFVEKSRKQSRNTGVELYISAMDQTTFSEGCVSIRVTPQENGTDPIIGYYIPSSGEWFSTKVKGKYAAATNVDGKINEEDGANGYVVELALSYDLIGGKTDSAQYAAAFVQSPDLGNDRLANTFLKGTNYLSPASWIGVTENGTLTSAEKNAYLDANIEVDSDMNIDGKLDDAKWQEVITAGKGKTITHTKTGISLTTYTLFSDKGVYIGLDSNDKEVWYNADRKAKYNTGAEIFISALGQTELTSSTAVQIRFNVGGGSVRYNAEPTWEYPWNQGYFQAKMAGSVKNNGELNKAVDTENGYTGVDGWQGEIFIPWSVFGATTEEEKSQINVFDCIYTSRGDTDYANDTEAGADGWNYLAPAGITVYGNGSGSVDPTKSFFKFTKADGFVYGGVEVPDVVFYESNGNYQATLSPKYIDAVTSDAFTTETKLTTGGTFTVDGISSDSFVGNVDGTYTLSLSKIDALKLENGKTATFTTADGVSTEFNLEYYNVDASKFDTSKLVSYLNFNGTAETILGSATSYVDRGTPVYTTYGTGAVNNSYLAANQKNSAIKVKSSVGTDSFVMSVLAKGSDIKKYATDAHIADNTKPSGYAFVLFGTDNVDGKVGFTVRVRMDAIQVRIAGNTNFHNDALTSLSDDWQRWTFVVDRETEGKLTYMLYLDETKIAEKTIDFDSATSLDVAGTVGIGAPGSTAENGYTDKSIGLDDFVYVTGTYSFYDLLDMFAWTNEANTKYAFDTDDITFDFTDVTTAGYTQQINVVAYPSDGSAIANVTDVTFGSEIASYITRGESDNFFTLTIPADKLADFKNGVKTTYTYNGASRTINVKYNALDQLYLDKTSFSSWKSGKTGTNYVFTVGVYGISDLTGPLTEVTFSDWTDYVVDNNDGTYTFTIPATVVEALTEPKTITASKGEGVGTADFTFEYLYLTDSELSALANATEAYYDFNGNVIDKIQGTETKAVKGSVTYNADNDALKVTCGKDASTASTLGAAISLGTESFTMSLDVKLNTKDFTGADASYEIISSGVDITKNASTDTFHFAATGGKSAANGQGNIRIQVGDNYIGCYYGSADGKVKLDQWQRYTIVVERGLACDDETKETVKTTLYMDGVFVQSRTRTIPKGSVLGNGTIYFGGSTTWSSRSSEIDNFTFVRKAMTAREVAALDSYYTEICAKVGWYVDNYTFDFTDITEGSAYTGTINFTTNGTGAVTTGATFTGLPEGVTITENTGVYTLNVPADKLSSLKGGVAVTAKIGDVERSFKITYIPLEKLYLDKSAVSMWSAEATGDNYNFSIKVYADEAKTFALDNVTFSDWNNYATFDTTNKVYNFAVPTSVVDALTEAKTITASRGEGVETADFTFTHNVLTDSEVNALAASTKAYIDFDGTITDKLGGNTFVNYGTVAYGNGTKYTGDQYFAANQHNTSIKLSEKVGTDSFTMSIMVNGDDVKNYASSGYSFILFGTGNVDGKTGFSVRVRSNALQVKFLGNRYDPSNQNSLVAALSGWQRWTFVVDRETEGKLTATLYIDSTNVYTKTIDFASTTSLDVDGYNTIGIGSVGTTYDYAWTSYTDKTIGLDDFVLVNRAITAKEVAALDSYYTEICAKVGWYVDNYTFDFTDITEGSAYTGTINFTTNGTGAVTTGATFTGLPEDVTITENTGVYTLNVPADKLSSLKGGVAVTAKIGDVERSFKITYIPLEKLYLDKSAVSMWSAEATDDNYNFSIKVYADEAKTFALDNVTFSDWNNYATYDTTNKVYNFAVPTSVVDALTEAKTITASRGEGVETADFTFEYLYLTDSELSALANATEAYYDFNGNVIDKIQNTATKAVLGTTTYNADNDALKVTCGKDASTASTLGAAISLGTESFTMSFDVKLYSADFSGNAGYEIISSGVDVGNSSATDVFQLSAHGDNKTLRIQVGDNTADFYYKNANLTNLKLDSFVRVTFVVERGLACDDTSKETVKTTLYLDGAMIQSKTRTMPKGAVLGNGTLYFGGNAKWTQKSSEIDNFTFVRKAMTAREVAALDSYYTEICAKVGWYVDNYTFDFTDITEGSAYTGTINFTTNGTGAVTTGATFTGLPEDVTIAESNGSYTLTIPYAKLDSFKNGVTVTAKVGSIEKSFTITYIPLENIYASALNFNEYEIDAGVAVTRTVKVTADTEGTVGLAGATFSGYPAGVTVVESSTTGEYTFTVPADKISDLVKSTVTASYEGKSTTVSVGCTEALLKDTNVYNYISTSGSSTVQGGQVLTGGDFGTDSFTVAMMAKGLNTCQNGGGFVLFSNGQADAYKGVSVYLNINEGNMGFRFRFPGMSNSTLKIGYDISKLTDWTHLAFTFDRSDATKVVITAYVNYTSVGSVTQAVTSGTSFSFGENKFIIGAYNSAAYASTSIATYSYNLSAAGATVYRGVAPISAIETYFDSLNLSLTYNEEVAKFTFADGATTNSVSGSSVTMTLSSGATETIKEGKDTATVTDDKAITLNSTSAYYDVNGFDVSTCSFMVSMDLKMDFSAALSTGGGKVLFATTNGSADTGLAVSIKQNTLRIRINGTTKFIAIDTDNNLNKWTNISIAFIRFNGKCRIVVLVNNAYAGREETAIANNVSLAGADNYLGIGRGTTSSDYENVSHTVDNIVLTKIN